MQLPEDPANVQLLQELPNSDDAITVLPAAKQCGQKRKLEDLGPKDPDQFNKHFKARPHPSANRNQTWELGPLLVLPRRELSLSYLVPMQAVGDSKERSVYTSHVRLLEKRNPTWNPLKEPIVAVVEDVDTHTFYAFEMIESGTYAVCRLGSWVKLDSLRQSALWEREAQPMVRSRGKILGRTSSWQSGSQPARLQDHELDGKRRRVEASTRMEALMRRSSQHGEAAAAKPMDVAAIQPVESGVGPVLSAVSRDTLLDPNPLPRPNNSITSPVQSHPQAGSSVQMTSNALEAPPRKDPIEVHQELVQQYLSALYLSQASLVFFAKSALSRARASLKGGECILSDNLRTMLLSNKVADKKYKTSIPTVVKELPPSFAGSEPTSMTPDQTSKKPKKMSSRKPKLGRNGLYKDEAAFVEQWWQARSFQEYTVHSANPDQPSDSLTSSLRIRESQLQVLLCLEIMSLTAATSAVPRLANSTSELDSQILPILKDPLTILEMLLDRISIWQSLLVSLDQPAKDALDTASQDVEQASPATTMHQSQDTLRDFFHEVVQPLYGPRVPETCLHIRRRLLPDAHEPSPKRSKPVRTKSRNSKPRPSDHGPNGATTVAPITLKQSLSSGTLPTSGIDGQNKTRVPRLASSSTEPSVLSSRRSSGSTLGGPRSNSQVLRPPSRANSVVSSKFTKREMDLSVPLSARPGLKKSASMQEDLDSAIRLIRKPNRGQAVKAFVEASEERSKPGLNGRERTRISDGMINRKIQIAATPSKPRAVPADAGVLPRVSRMNNVVTSTPPRPPLLESIACRNSASSLRESTDMDANERVNGRTKTVMCTPAKRRDHEGGFHQSLTVAATTRIAATPAKGDGRSNGEDVGPAGERTIYEQLGWDTVDELA